MTLAVEDAMGVDMLVKGGILEELYEIAELDGNEVVLKENRVLDVVLGDAMDDLIAPVDEEDVVLLLGNVMEIVVELTAGDEVKPEVVAVEDTAVADVEEFAVTE